MMPYVVKLERARLRNIILFGKKKSAYNYAWLSTKTGTPKTVATLVDATPFETIEEAESAVVITGARNPSLIGNMVIRKLHEGPTGRVTTRAI